MTPMKFSSPLFSAAVAFGACGLSSCGSSDSIDLKFPTVQQMDDMDTQWGLSRRKPRGTSSRGIVYDPAAGVVSAGGAGGDAIQAPVIPDTVLDAGPRSSMTTPSAPASVIPDPLC